MPRRAISITLEADNIVWLKGRADAANTSVSGLVDQIVSAARDGGGRAMPTRSVIGTIDVDSSDPLLDRADEVLRAAFDESLGRPLTVRDGSARKKRRG